MYRMPVIIGKISPDRVNRTPTRSEGNWFPLKGLKFGDVLYIIPLITRLRAKTKKWLHMVWLVTIYLLPSFVVLISREIVRQRRWCRLATEDAGVEKLPDLLRSDTKDVIIGKRSFVFLDSGQFMSSYHKLTKLWRAHASERNVPRHWEDPCNNP